MWLLLFDALAIGGSIFFLWRGAKRLVRFFSLASQTSFHNALLRTSREAYRQAWRCAYDPPYFLARLAIFGSAIALSAFATLAFLEIAISADVPNGVDHQLLQLANQAALLSLLLFTWMIFRTSRLARRVLFLRQRRRSRIRAAMRRAASIRSAEGQASAPRFGTSAPLHSPPLPSEGPLFEG